MEPTSSRQRPRSATGPVAAAARRLRLAGRVQGVGFRPFVYRLACRLGLTGWVQNRMGQVEILAQGEPRTLEAFAHALIAEAPPLARPQIVTNDVSAPQALDAFTIRLSAADGAPRIHVPPDYFACNDCLRELDDPRDRRHRYPFINCTQCGPRYTLITRLPYDRPNTTMAAFPLCPDCRREYEDPLDRRLHAEPVACPACGPQLQFRAAQTRLVDDTEAALAACLAALRAGRIVAVKGIGGYHLMCDARDEVAVARLRAAKPRPAKPLAVMFPWRGADGLEAVREVVTPNAEQARLLRDPMRPIILVEKRANALLSPDPPSPARGGGGAALPRLNFTPIRAAERAHTILVRPGGSEGEGETALDSTLSPSPSLKGEGAQVAGSLSENIAPGLKEIGCFLPYSPLHHLIMKEFGGPLVATSANVSGEPVLTDHRDVEARLGHVADAFLHHNRPIERPADDPVYRMIAGSARPLRLGRGVAPLECALPFRLAQPVLAVGGHMKNTVALAWDDRIVISPHIADLGTPRSLAVFEQVLADLQALYGVRAARVACDAHPGYASTRWARRSGLPVTPVFHHRAHAAALAGEYPQVENWLVFAWDGVGYGEDGTLWGGEALLGKPGEWTRVASFRPFRLPGGEKAAREPWRSAAALCWETGLEWKACPEDTTLLRAAWERGVNAPLTSAVGRLFDAAAALTGVNLKSSFEGQGPMYLEAVCAAGEAVPLALPLARGAGGLWRTDWAPLLPVLMDGARPVAERAAVFHASLAEAVLAQARAARREHGGFAVGLSGGVFQNRVLAERVLTGLKENGFEVYLSSRIPVNDAGLSFGQIIEVSSF